MPRRAGALGSLIASVVFCISTNSPAQPSSSSARPLTNAADQADFNTPSATGPAAHVRPLTSAEQAAPLPSGHPSTQPPAATPLPPDHPAVRNPNELPQNGSHEDPTLAPGTIAIEVRNAKGDPVPNTEVTLGVIQQSIAKGESRRHVSARTDSSGNTVFSQLETGVGMAYRVSVPFEGATYAAPPFQLPLQNGMRVSISLYPVTQDVEKGRVALQGMLYLEIKDEVIQLDEAYRMFNLGDSTWLPHDVVLSLPSGFKAFTTQQTMSDIGWDAVEHQGARLHGTIDPGQHDTGFRVQVPYDGSEDFSLTLGLAPHVQAFRVITEAPRGMRLEVEGFPPAEATSNENGQRVLITERQTQRIDQTLRQIHVHLVGLPTRPTGRWYAVFLALGALAAGFYVALRKPTSAAGAGALALEKSEIERARRALLQQAERLEQARQSGEIGPKTYERARHALVDALAHLLAHQGKTY